MRLGERMNELSPMKEPAMSFFCQSGTESVEGALKLARYVTGRPRFIGFIGGFHGRTMGSLSFTSSKYTQQQGFFPTMPGVTHVPYPNNYRPLFAGADQGEAVLRYIEEVLFAGTVPASEVAAILIEPIQGEGGYLVPPPGFLAGLRALCDRHGILLIFDEVQSGIGRTGKMFAAEHFDVVPDIMTLAKGLGSGLPIGMVIAKATIMQKWKRGAHGNTFGGNPLCCAAALATHRPGAERADGQCGQRRRVLHGQAARAAGTPPGDRRDPRPRTHDRHGTGDRPRQQGPGEGAVRHARRPRLLQRAAAAGLRQEHAAVHAAAVGDAGRGG